MNIRLFIFGIILTTLFSCKKIENETESSIEEISTENYSLEVPTDFERTYSMNELAKVQFRKDAEDLYFIVLEEPKKGFEKAVKLKVHDVSPDLMGYFKVVTSHFDEINDNFKVGDFGRTKINSCNAIVFSMTGKGLDDGKTAFLRYALLEDDKNFYQIMSWTNIHYKDKLIGKMEGIINSFKSKSLSK